MILYFSGTGNSKYVAKRIADALGDALVNLNDRIKASDTSPVETGERVIIVTPTYAWRIPRIVRDWLLKTELRGARLAWFVMTCGSEIGNAGRYNRELCVEKAISCMGTAQIVMPENYIAMFAAPQADAAREIVAKAEPKEWQFQTDFSELHTEFPELVDADGVGWFLRHVLRAAGFMLAHPEKMRSTSLKYAEVIRSKFVAAWRSRVMQYQIPIFASQTKGAWTLRFDDVLANALELGPLRREGSELPLELTEKVTTALPKEIPSEVVCTLIRYYLANRQDDCEWVVLPVASFDAYFGDTSFSKKYLPKITPEIMERSNAFGISRYRVTEEYLP